MKTKVIFRKWPAREGGDVIALFPDTAATVGNPYHCQSFEHLGQHGAADPMLITRQCVLATAEEYKELAQELRWRGYKLDIRKRITQADLQARKEQLSA
jgi:hypothetical protein